MNIKLKPVLLTSVVAISMLLNACSTASYNQVALEPIDSWPIDKVAEQSKIHVDWSKIDSDEDVAIDNSPRNVEYSPILQAMAEASNAPVADIYRFQTVYDSTEAKQVIDKIKEQLGDSYVDMYLNGLGTPKYHIVTLGNVVADEHEYVMTKGNARGFSLLIEILPIADRSRAAILDVYDSPEDIEKIDKIVKKYGGEMQGIGYSPEGFKISIDSHFATPLTPARHSQMENELRQLTGVNLKVNSTGRLVY